MRGARRKLKSSKYGMSFEDEQIWQEISSAHNAEG